MRKCYIITAYIEGELLKLMSPSLVNESSPFIICADGGYEIAMSSGIVPALVIGDADSGAMTYDSQVSLRANITSNFEATEFIHIKKEKDESDTFLAVQHAVAAGFEAIDILGGIGGRFDHTISNIQTLAYFSSKTRRIAILDETNFITIVENSSITLQQKENWSISLFSFSDVCQGVTTAGLYYPLQNATLRNLYPLGLSNEFTGDEATIEVKQGKLIVIMSEK